MPNKIHSGLVWTDTKNEKAGIRKRGSEFESVKSADKKEDSKINLLGCWFFLCIIDRCRCWFMFYVAARARSGSEREFAVAWNFVGYKRIDINMVHANKPTITKGA